jgi:hypothetical protein
VAALFHVHFAGECSIFNDARLLELAVEAGLDEGDAVAVLADESAYADAVRADEQGAAVLGANGVPFFVLDRKYGVSSGQPAGGVHPGAGGGVGDVHAAGGAGMGSPAGSPPRCSRRRSARLGITTRSR